MNTFDSRPTIPINFTKVNFIGPCPFNETPNNQYFFVFVDGGLGHKNQIESENFFSIGDGDSFTGKQELDIKLPIHKNRSDLYYALEELPLTIEELNLYGFSGGRFDHWLFNIGEILFFLDSRPSKIHANLYGDPTIKFFPSGKHLILNRGSFSLFSAQQQKVDLRGTGYDGSFPLEPFNSRGLSNISEEKIELTCERPVAILITSKN